MSFANPSRDRGSPALPLAPMIDMMFLMLIFFLWTAAQREEGRDIPIQLQQTEGGSERRAAVPIYITINEKNEIFIGPRSYTLESARDALGSLGAAIPGESPAQRAARIERTPVIIRGDKTSNLGTTLEVLGLARAAGLTNVVMETAKKDGK
jgi:biopolymer transport protein ExbD